MGFEDGLKFNVDALKGTVFRGKKYRTLKSFGSKRKAELFYDKIESRMPSKRYPPVLESVKVGKLLGFDLGTRYRVKIPKDVKIKI